MLVRGESCWNQDGGWAYGEKGVGWEIFWRWSLQLLLLDWMWQMGRKETRMTPTFFTLVTERLCHFTEMGKD